MTGYSVARKYLFPTRVMLADGAIQNAERLLCPCDLQAALLEKETAAVRGRGSLILDYGKEICGGVKLVIHNAAKNCTVRFRFGESLSEACAELGERGACNDHSVRDFYAEVVPLSMQVYGDTGFRFLRIDFPEDADLTVKAVAAVSFHYSREYEGRFSCSDKLVNDIYDTARYTCSLNMQEFLWDGVKRDRLVWIGDMHPELLAINCLYGRDECLDTSIRYAAATYPLPSYMNTMMAYSLWFVIILKDHYMQNGDDSFTKGYFPYIQGLFEMVENKIDGDGVIDGEPYFFDWPTKEMERGAGGDSETRSGFRSLFILALDAAIYLSLRFGYDCKLFTRIKNKMLERRAVRPKSKQALAFYVLSGQADANKQSLEELSLGGGRGLSTFMAYYILKAVGASGGNRTAVDVMKEYYGGMLGRGATTFWEDFDLEWLSGSGRIDEFTKDTEKDLHGDYGHNCFVGFRKSLCHGWAAGAVPFLTETVLGVNILEPGCKKVMISPDLCGLSYAEGVYPTPYGAIELYHKQGKGSEIITRVKAPIEVEIVLKNCRAERSEDLGGNKNYV